MTTIAPPDVASGATRRSTAVVRRDARGTISEPLPALVLGSGITALGVTRVLGAAGISVYVATGPDRLVRHSRWFHPAPGGAYAGHGLAEYLDGLRIPRAVLIPCSDHAVLDVALLGDALTDRFPRIVAPPGVLERLIDKARFHDLLEALDVPRPHTFWLHGAEDLDRIGADRLTNAFLKPRDSQAFHDRFGEKAFRVASRDDARRRLAAVMAEGLDVVLQEYVPGPPDHHYFIDAYADTHSRIRALFGRRRLRMYPPDFGNSTYMRSVPIEEVEPAARNLTRIIEALRFRGICSAEFKRDPRDGQFKLLEINTRPWWYVEFAARCGVDVCRMAYNEALGLDPGDVRSYATGRRLVYPYYDFPAALAQWRSGALSAAKWLGSWVGALQPVFTWRDPLPVLHALHAWVGRQLRKRLLRRGAQC